MATEAEQVPAAEQVRVTELEVAREQVQEMAAETVVVTEAVLVIHWEAEKH